MRPRICRLGEETWVVEFEPTLDPQTNDCVLAMTRAMDRQKLAGVLDVVPAIASLAVHVDGDLIDENVLSATLERLADVPPEQELPRASHDVPVCYEGNTGPTCKRSLTGAAARRRRSSRATAPPSIASS